MVIGILPHIPGQKAHTETDTGTKADVQPDQLPSRNAKHPPIGMGLMGTKLRDYLLTLSRQLFFCHTGVLSPCEKLIVKHFTLPKSLAYLDGFV